MKTIYLICCLLLILSCSEQTKIKTEETNKKVNKEEKIEKVLICYDCETRRGDLHTIFCSKELCPFCETQLTSCKCIFKVLNLDLKEKNAVEDYVDDTEEPLKSILTKWEKVLNAKGRIPLGEDLKILGVE